MKRILITGADGFVGRWMTRGALLLAGEVVAAVHPDAAPVESWLDASDAKRVRAIRGDLRSAELVTALVDSKPAAVIHLAAIASGVAARKDPALAWTVNAGVTATLVEAFARSTQPKFLLASTGEVYGKDHSGPISESAPLAPVSPYAATKVGAEAAALECWRRTGLPVTIARPFPHTGPGQSDSFVFPALARRLREAAATGAQTIPVGNLEPVRDLLDVRDVITAYLGIIDRGLPGEAYNIASGVGLKLSVVYEELAKMTGSNAQPVADAALLRSADLPVLIGDASKLRATTGWAPAISVDRTLQDLVDAQAH